MYEPTDIQRIVKNVICKGNSIVRILRHVDRSHILKELRTDSYIDRLLFYFKPRPILKLINAPILKLINAEKNNRK